MYRTVHHAWVLLLLASTTLAADFKWIDDKASPGFNCAGKVTDALCCQDTVCSAATEAECKSGNKQFLCSWTGGRCRSFRDTSNNVCCQSDVKDACKKILEGVCPEEWQVPENCCSALSSKYQGVLTGVKPGYVCCNAPCAEMKKAGCALPEKCSKPTPRGFGFNPFSQLGFSTAQMVGQQMSIGNVLQGTGFGGDFGSTILAGLGDAKSKNQQVDEITVDDMMTMLIDALSEDKDAMVFNSEINSDPYMGKIRSGGPLASLNLPNPNIFLDQFYGNPFGMSGANMFGSFPSMPNFYPQAMLGLPTPTSPYAASPYYPQTPYPAFPVPGMPQPFQPSQPQQLMPQPFMDPAQFMQQQQFMMPSQHPQQLMPQPFMDPAQFMQQQQFMMPSQYPQQQFMMPSQYPQQQFMMPSQYPQPVQYGPPQPSQYQQPAQYGPGQPAQYSQPAPAQYQQPAQYGPAQPAQYPQPAPAQPSQYQQPAQYGPAQPAPYQQPAPAQSSQYQQPVQYGQPSTYPQQQGSNSPSGARQ